MKIIWKYWKAKNGLRILKVYTDGKSVTVPAEIDGVPVTEIGPYTFSASELPARFKVPENEICEYVQEEGLLGLGADEEPPEFSGDRVETILLPDTVEVIGDYAFYGCRELKKVGFSSTLKRTGTGLFVGCAAVRYMEYHILKKGSKALAQMLSDVRYTITVTIRDDSEVPGEVTKLCFPEYFEMSIENHAARMFDSRLDGMGFRYRQSFVGGMVNYKFYDEQLELAYTLTSKENLAELALARLQYPKELTEERRKAYLEYFSRFAWEAGEWLIKRDDTEAIRFLAEAGAFDGNTDTVSELFMIASRAEQASDAEGTGDFYTQAMGESGFGGYVEKGREEEELAKRASSNALDVMLNLAGKYGKTEVVSILMDYRHKKQGAAPKKRKTFDL